MRPLFLPGILLACLVVILAVGCGGGGGGQQPQSKGNMNVLIKWPTDGPYAASVKSMTVTLTGKGGYTSSQTKDRPASGDTLVTFTNIPSGEVVVSTTAYDAPGGTGNPVIQGASHGTVIASQTATGVTFNMGGTAERLEVTPSSAQLAAGGSLALAATLYDALGQVVLVPASNFAWSTSNALVASVFPAGGVGNVKSSGKGEATITVTESSTGKTAHVTVTVESGVTLTAPGETTAPGSIGGTVITIAPRPSDATALIDQAYNATVTVTGTPDAGGSYTKSTQSTVRGGYNFAGVPAGTYTVSATVKSPYDATTLSGQLTGVRVRGNIPTLMANLLLGTPGQMAQVTGTITQNGHPAAGAVVSMDITAHTTEYPSNPSALSSIILSKTTDGDGKYQFTVPVGGTDYYVAAHSDSSMVAQTNDITSLDLTQPNVYNLDLPAAEQPVFATMTLDIVSSTLPAPTAQAAQQSLISRIAVARALQMPKARLDRLLQLRTAPRGSTGMRSFNGIVENDLYFYLQPATPGQTFLDLGVRGYNVYRAPSVAAPFVQVGSSNDPYQEMFFDNDPVLNDLQERYYTVTSYASYQQQSVTAPPILAKPLPQISVAGPDAGSSIPRATGKLSWNTVPGAKSYVVLKFTTEPTYDATPIVDVTIHRASDTSEGVASLPPTVQSFWWSVTAYNTTDPNFATAISTSTYRQVTLTNN